jgi:hypothetical protein
MQVLGMLSVFFIFIGIINPYVLYQEIYHFF